MDHILAVLFLTVALRNQNMRAIEEAS